MEDSMPQSETHVKAADATVERAEAILVSTQDFTRILDLLEHPPIPNDKLKAAITALPETL
jgi:uncharacterized protein (DUF1778 family)